MQEKSEKMQKNLKSKCKREKVKREGEIGKVIWAGQKVKIDRKLNNDEKGKRSDKKNIKGQMKTGQGQNEKATANKETMKKEAEES